MLLADSRLVGLLVLHNVHTGHAVSALLPANACPAGAIDPCTHEPFPERLFRPLQPLALNALPAQQQQEGPASGKGASAALLCQLLRIAQTTLLLHS